MSVSLPPLTSCGAPNIEKSALPQDPSGLVLAALKTLTQLDTLHSSHGCVISLNPVSREGQNLSYFLAKMRNLGRCLLEMMILNDDILPNLNIPRITRTKFRGHIWKLTSLVR